MKLIRRTADSRISSMGNALGCKKQRGWVENVVYAWHIVFCVKKSSPFNLKGLPSAANSRAMKPVTEVD
jgi:hypothetical protein